MSKLMPTAIKNEVLAALADAARGQAAAPFLTAYELLDLLPVARRDQLIAERGMPGEGSGSTVGAARIVATAGAMLVRGGAANIDFRPAGLPYTVAGQTVHASGKHAAFQYAHGGAQS
ncbi:MAG: hypothetical protein V4850_16365 [Myxococcota bacterium]